VITLEGMPAGMYHAQLVVPGKATESIPFVKE
jgi:hypothetical protein